MWRFGLAGWCAVLLGVSACDAAQEVDVQSDEGAFIEDESAVRRTLLVEDVTLNATGSWSAMPQKKLFRSGAEFDKFFGAGSARASGLDFRKHWALLYSAGRQNTGGFTARIDRIEVSETGKTMYPFATFRSPGPGCMVTQALTKPYHLVRFSKARVVPTSLRWTIDRPVRYCSCEELSCSDSEVCLESEGEALCVGRTSCLTARCTATTYCDDSSGLAQCLPRTTCAATLCGPRTYCTEASGTAECVGFSTCANVRCASGTRCHEDPVTDCAEASCPPTHPVCR